MLDYLIIFDKSTMMNSLAKPLKPSIIYHNSYCNVDSTIIPISSGRIAQILLTKNSQANATLRQE